MIIGHKKIIASFERAFEKGAFSHGYLFSGPRSVGKFTLALQLAEKLTKSEGPINSNLLIISPEEEEKRGIVKKKDIKIAAVREIESHLYKTSFGSGKRVAIIDDAQRLTIAAQNAILKILEEPPENSCIFVITSDASKLLPTIVSRLEMKKFGLAPGKEISGFVPDGPDKEEIIFWSMGRPGIAKELLGNDRELGMRREAVGEIKKIMSGDTAEIFSASEELAKDEADTIKKLEWWLYAIRASYLGQGSGFTVAGDKAFVAQEKISGALETIRKTNASTRLVLENLFLSIQ